jgi:hypothetical protein
MVHTRLTQDVMQLFKDKRLYGIDKERLQFLIECQFATVNNYELVLIAAAMNLYNYEFEIKYSLTLKIE